MEDKGGRSVFGDTVREMLFQLARGIAVQFGPNCEVVVHDLTGGENAPSIVCIENAMSPAGK